VVSHFRSNYAGGNFIDMKMFIESRMNPCGSGTQPATARSIRLNPLCTIGRRHVKHSFPRLFASLIFFVCVRSPFAATDQEIEARIGILLPKMTLEEKIGQLCQENYEGRVTDALAGRIRNGEVGSFLNAGDLETKNALQRIAVGESRMGIPLIYGRDVIHGYRTVFPIPIGQSCSWNPDLVEMAARAAATEAASDGVHWTFAPMVDIARDPRWGRIAEGCGEDPFLASALAAAMVRGFQGRRLSDADAVAACAKHYVGYGAAEGGRDYNTTWIPERLLRDVYLPSFHAAVDAGAATLMSAFNDLNGVPASGNAFTLRQVLRKEWGFDGFVVSDWASIQEMVNHGFCADETEAAKKGLEGGVDMEMVTDCYRNHLANLVREGKIPESLVDESAKNVLRVKFRKGLFERPFTGAAKGKTLPAAGRLALAKQLAVQSLVLLKNEKNALPLSPAGGRVAVIGPLADSPADQLGCWVMDGRPEDAVTPLAAIRSLLGKDNVPFARGLRTSRDEDRSGFAEAVRAAESADAVILFLGEEAAITGEAKSRAFIGLPGRQEELAAEVAETGKPLVLIVMAGRPLTFGGTADLAAAVLYAWHPGTMGGPAIADVLFGFAEPSGKLTVSFPQTLGQSPVYYNHMNTGRPLYPETWILPSVNDQSRYIDVDNRPRYPFGYGLSYTTFRYDSLAVSSGFFRMNGSLTVSATVTNTGKRAGDEIVQLYIRDLAASVTRPVKELKGFKRISLNPGESRTVVFTLKPSDLAFWNDKMEFKAEPGRFHVWIGPNSAAGLKGEFSLTD
jgi:beta-glucosidase